MPGRTGARKPAGKAKANAPGAQQVTANQLFTAFMVATMSFLVFALWPDLSEARHYDAMTLNQGLRRGRVATVCSGGVCGLEAKKPTKKGDPLVTIPASTMITYQSIRDEPGFEDLIALDNTFFIEAMQKAGQQPQYIMGGFSMAFKLWHERKMGSSSSLSSWFDLLPKHPQSSLYLPEEEAVCLDQLTYDERNRTLSMSRAFAEVIQALCESESGSAVGGCYYMNKDTLFEEVKYAVALTASRTWGESANPMLVPLVDFAFPHPDLCNPDGDGDVKCKGRAKRSTLIPANDEAQGTIVFRASRDLAKDEKLYAVPLARAPWETFGLYGYVDYAANIVSDLEFANRMQIFAQANQIRPADLATDHPLKSCMTREVTQWEAGSPKKELRYCWSNLFYFTENPEHLTYDDEGREAYGLWKDGRVAQAKSKYLAWRHTAASARNLAHVVGLTVGGEQPAHCNDDSGSLPEIRKVREVSKSMFAKIFETSDRKADEAFAKWVSLDASANREVPEPQAAAALDEDDDEDEDESSDPPPVTEEADA